MTDFHGPQTVEVNTGRRTITLAALSIIDFIATGAAADDRAFPLNKAVIITDFEAAIGKAGPADPPRHRQSGTARRRCGTRDRRRQLRRDQRQCHQCGRAHLLTHRSAIIRRRDGDRHRFSIEKQDEVTGTEASYHDLDAGKKKTMTAGKKGKTRKLSRTYTSEGEARAGATAEQTRAARLPFKLSFDLALGRPDLYPERRITASGFKAKIEAQS